MTKMCSIYKISFTDTDWVYIGSALKPESRRKQHLSELNNGKHHSVKLQRYFSKYKSTPSFDIIETCTESERHLREDYWINYYDSLHNGFNMIPAERVLSWEELLKIKENNKRHTFLYEREKLLADDGFCALYGKLLNIVTDIGQEIRPDVVGFNLQLFDQAGFRCNASLKNLKSSIEIGITLFKQALSDLDKMPIDGQQKTIYVRSGWLGGQVLLPKPTKKMSGYINTKSNFILIMESLLKYNRYDKIKILNQMLEEDYNLNKGGKRAQENI